MHRAVILLIGSCFTLAGNSHAGDAPRSSITLDLVQGENFISIPLQPDRAALAEVFPAATLPAGKDEADSTVLLAYDGTADAQAPAAYIRLSDDGHWMYSTGGIADAAVVSAGEAFNIRLPAGAAATTLVVSGVPPSEPVVLRLAGDAGATNYNVVGWPYPCPVRVSDLGLLEAGFVGGLNVAQSDEVRILDNTDGQGSSRTPKARIWLNAKSSQFEFTAPRSGPAGDYAIEPGEAIVVVRKRAPSLMWKPVSSCQPPVAQ